MNNRALRDTVTSLGGIGNGIPRQTGFDITAASEVLAILRLPNDLDELQKHLGELIVTYTWENQSIIQTSKQPVH